MLIAPASAPVQNWRKRFPGHFESAMDEAVRALLQLAVDGQAPILSTSPLTQTLAFQLAVEAAFNRGAQSVADVVTAMFDQVVFGG